MAGFFDEDGAHSAFAAPAEEREETEQYEEEGDADGDYGVMDEVDARLEMANYYKLFLNGSVFSDSDSNPVAQAVETEFRAFAKDRLGVLLGMKAPEAKQVALPFNADEIKILKMWVEEILARKKGKPTLVQKSEPTPAPTAKPVAAAPQKPRLLTIQPKVATPEPERPKSVVPEIPLRARKPGRPKGAKDKQPRKTPTPKEQKTLDASFEVDGHQVKVRPTKMQVRPSGPNQPLPMPTGAMIEALEVAKAGSAESRMINVADRNDPTGY